tara:strand:+ start:340 stop:666 length:327 start_codon:yes stop_codon:yes gene_type:complete
VLLPDEVPTFRLLLEVILLVELLPDINDAYGDVKYEYVGGDGVGFIVLMPTGVTLVAPPFLFIRLAIYIPENGGLEPVIVVLLNGDWDTPDLNEPEANAGGVAEPGLN